MKLTKEEVSTLLIALKAYRSEYEGADDGMDKLQWKPVETITHKLQKLHLKLVQKRG